MPHFPTSDKMEEEEVEKRRVRRHGNTTINYHIISNSQSASLSIDPWRIRSCGEEDRRRRWTLALSSLALTLGAPAVPEEGGGGGEEEGGGAREREAAACGVDSAMIAVTRVTSAE